MHTIDREEAAYLAREAAAQADPATNLYHTFITTSARIQDARELAPHFCASQHEETLIVFGGLCGLVLEPHTIKTRNQYAWHLRESLSRVIEGIRDNGKRTSHDDQIIELLRGVRGTIDPVDTKAGNGARVLRTLSRIEDILADDFDACSCVTRPNDICFAEAHIV